MTAIFPIFVLLLISSMFPEPSDSLKLKVIHRSALESPASRGKLNSSENIGKWFRQSRRRVQALNNRAFSARNQNRSTVQADDDDDDPPETVRPHVTIVDDGGIWGYSFGVQVGIGSFPGEQPTYKSYFLMIDTASSFIWLQCDSCLRQGNQCYHQTDPLYPNFRSHSYHPFYDEDDDWGICDPDLRPPKPHPDHDLCFYSITYLDNSQTIGQVGHEMFTFDSDDPYHFSIIEDVIFGCGFKQTGFEEMAQPPLLAGIIGMGSGDLALQEQLGDESALIFSHCFQDFLHDQNHQRVQPPNTFLRLGHDVDPDRSTYSSTHLFHIIDEEERRLHLHHIRMKDIMINNQPLMIDVSAFLDTIIDSGSPVTVLTPLAFQALLDSLAQIFAQNSNYQKIQLAQEGFCYAMLVPEGYENLPTIQLILEDNAIYEIKPEQGFLITTDQHRPGQYYFCLMFLPTAHDYNIIGAHQMINKRIIFDTEVVPSMLYFKNEDCANNP